MFSSIHVMWFHTGRSIVVLNSQKPFIYIEIKTCIWKWLNCENACLSLNIPKKNSFQTFVVSVFYFAKVQDLYWQSMTPENLLTDIRFLLPSFLMQCIFKGWLDDKLLCQKKTPSNAQFTKEKHINFEDFWVF